MTRPGVPAPGFVVSAIGRVLTASKEEREEMLAFLDSVREKEACDAQQYRFYCDIFAGMSIFSHCPETLPDPAGCFPTGRVLPAV